MANCKPFIYIFGTLGFLFALCFFSATAMNISHIEKIIAALLMFLFGFLAVFFACKGEKDERVARRRMKGAFMVFSALYFVMFLDFTLIDGTFGRNLSVIFSLSSGQKAEYMAQNTNFIPFKTVKLFMVAFKEDTLSITAIVENVLGNFFVLMPFSFFMQGAFKSMGKPFKFLLVCCISVIGVEMLQLVFLTGSADIDDFILNVLGAMAAYGILNVPLIKSRLKQITFGAYGE